VLWTIGRLACYHGRIAMEETPQITCRKHEIRAEAHARRNRQADAETLSRRIFDQLTARPEYREARTILSYVNFHSEVWTRQFIAKAWDDGKCVAVPYCVGDRLDLFRLENFEELSPGILGILEPRLEFRGRPDRLLAAEQFDVIVVPGLAFDRSCGRIGYGKGYYDRLLRQIRPDTIAVAVAFECQIFPEVPVTPHDVRVDEIITESTVYRRSLPRFNGHGSI